MFAIPYVQVHVSITGEQSQVYSVPTCDAHEFAAERYEHYRPQLGEYLGSSRVEDDRGIRDSFQGGFIFIAD